MSHYKDQLQQLHKIVKEKLYHKSLDIIRTNQEMNKFELREVSADLLARIEKLID